MEAQKQQAQAAESAKKAAAETKRKRDAVENPDGAPPESKRPKVGEVVGTIQQFATEVLLDQTRLILRNTSTSNKKIPTDTVVVSFTQDAKLSEVSPCNFTYDLQMKTDIVANGTLKRMKLDKFMKEVGSPTQEIYGYTKFPAGSAPKVLVKKGKNWKFRLDSPGPEQSYKVIEAARVAKAVSLHWIVKHNAKNEQIVPVGLAAIIVKSVQVPGNGGVLELA